MLLMSFPFTQLASHRLTGCSIEVVPFPFLKRVSCAAGHAAQPVGRGRGDRSLTAA